MGFNDTRRYIKGSDLVMLRRILDGSGLPDGADHKGQAARDAAARLLIGLFEKGTIAEDQLTESLRTSMAAPGPDDDAASPCATTGGYRFGRRIETNGTWTIYHVFSGVPAEHASWKMVGLNVKTADRALKILNAPETVGPAS